MRPADVALKLNVFGGLLELLSDKTKNEATAKSHKYSHLNDPESLDI